MGKLTTVMNLKDKVTGGLNKVANGFKKINSAQDKIKRSTQKTTGAIGQQDSAFQREMRTAKKFHTDFKNGMRDAKTSTDKVTESIERTTRAVKKTQDTLGKGDAFKGLTNSSNSFFKSFKQKLFGLPGLIAGLGLGKLFKFTIGGAADIEQIKVFLGLQLGATQGAKALDFITSRAKSSIFSFKELAKAASSFSTILKNSDEIEDFTKFAERLSFLDPAQGFTGASLALKELLSGETRSLRQRFELPISDALKKAVKKGDLAEITKALSELIPITEAQMDELAETGSGGFSRLASNVKTGFQQAGDLALQFLKPVLAEMNAAFVSGEFDQFFDDLALGLTVVVDGLITFVGWLKLAATWVQNNSSVLIPIVTTLGVMALVIGVVTTATKAWAVAQGLVNATLLLNPIVLIIVAYIALITAIISLIAFNEKFRTGFANVFGFVVEFFQKVVNFLISGYNKIIEANGSLLKGLNTLKTGVGSIWGGIVTFILNGVEKIIAALNKIPGVNIDLDVAGFKDSITGAIDDAKNTPLEQLDLVDFTDFIDAGKEAIENFDGEALLEKLKKGFEDKFAIPEIKTDNLEIGDTETTKLTTGGIDSGGGGADEGFTLNEFVIDNLGNILDGPGRESFIQPIEDNRTIEVKLADNVTINSDVDEQALLDRLLEALETALEEERETNSSLVIESP